MAFSAAGVAYIVVGGLVMYSGIKGATLADTAKSVLSGNLNVQDTETIQFGSSGSSDIGNAAAAGALAGAGDTGASNNTAAQNQALAKKLAIQMGLSSWTTGQEWTDWVSLWNKESSWQDEKNSSSNASGIAQNINGYSSSYQKGNMPQQITWGINYIRQRYGSPTMAWAHEVANNWY